MTGQDASQWYIARDGKQTGPISEAEIRAIAQHGYFRSTDLVWRPGFAEWTPALSVFKPAVRDAAPPPVASAAPAPAASYAAPQTASQLAPQPQIEPSVLQASQPSVQPSPQPTQVSQQATGWAQSPANTVPAPREVPAPRDVPAPREITARHPARPGPIAADAAAYDDAVRNGDPRFAANAPAQPAAFAPSGYAPGGHQSGPQPGPAQVAAAPFSNRIAQPESGKLPVAPPYRGEGGGYRPQGDGAPAGMARDTTGRPAAREPAQSGSTAPQSRRTVAKVDAGLEPEAKPRSRKGLYAVGTVMLAAVAGSIWIAANPGVLEGLPSVKSLSIGTSSSVNKTADLEARWQQTAHWPVIKREFPDWYGERLREAVQLASESKPDDEINKTLVDQLITLRRQNSALALAASTQKLRALASAFLANLKQLKSQSTTACFNFISQGEGTAGVIDQFQVMDGTKSTMQLQVAAIFDAIGEGRKSPVTHEKPVKSDYDALMDQLGKLGWSQTDVATFADPKALAKAEPARVCQMVQDWFVAHISITDEAAQERLLGETLRPVVSG